MVLEMPDSWTTCGGELLTGMETTQEKEESCNSTVNGANQYWRSENQF